MRDMKQVEEDILLTFDETADVSRRSLFALRQLQRIFFLKQCCFPKQVIRFCV